MDKKNDYKLRFELVPDGCWYSNLRSILPAESWNYIKKNVKTRACGKCEICGETCDRLEAHERWSYDEKKRIQKLEDVIAVCPKCHSVLHIGRTQLKGNAEEAEDQFMKVNGCTYAEMRKEMGIANDEQKRRNLVSEWKLDLSYLKKFTE